MLFDLPSSCPSFRLKSVASILKWQFLHIGS